MTILCERDRSTVDALLSAFDEPVQTVKSLPDAATALVSGTGEHTLVIGPKADLDDVLKFADGLRVDRPDVAVLLLRDELVAEQVDAALRAGIRDVVSSRDPRTVRDACRRAWITVVPRASDEEEDRAMTDEDCEASSAAEGQRGRVVTVFAPKGGSGKTTVSTNLATALHRRGVRVCLVDLDLEFGDVAIALQLPPARTLIDGLQPLPLRDSDLVNQVVVEYRPGFDCVLAPIEPGHAERISAELVGDLMETLRRHYDYVVVDSPSQFTEQVLAAMDRSDVQVLVSNPEIPSIKNLRLTLDMLDLLGYPRDARAIVFNKADPAAGMTAAEVERTLDAAIAVSVPASRDIPASINRGVPIVAAKPDHPVSRAIDQLVAKNVLTDQASPARRSVLARLRGRKSA